MCCVVQVLSKIKGRCEKEQVCSSESGKLPKGERGMIAPVRGQQKCKKKDKSPGGHGKGLPAEKGLNAKGTLKDIQRIIENGCGSFRDKRNRKSSYGL